MALEIHGCPNGNWSHGSPARVTDGGASTVWRNLTNFGGTCDSHGPELRIFAMLSFQLNHVLAQPKVTGPNLVEACWKLAARNVNA